jgi:hypothetical protein
MEDFSIPYWIEMRTREDWSPAMRDFATDVIEKIKKAKTREEKVRIVQKFKKWTEDYPEIQY